MEESRRIFKCFYNFRFVSPYSWQMLLKKLKYIWSSENAPSLLKWNDSFSNPPPSDRSKGCYPQLGSLLCGGRRGEPSRLLGWKSARRPQGVFTFLTQDESLRRVMKIYCIPVSGQTLLRALICSYWGRKPLFFLDIFAIGE